MATTPPSEDPQVPGNYPGTVQNPTQVPAPVNPVTDPEVPALPNDVDPNFITNPEPVNNTIDPEVPQPEENFPRKKRFDAEPVVPVTNPEVPQPQDFGSEPPTGFPPAQDFGADPQIGLPPAQDFGSEPPILVPDAQDFGTDPQVPDAQDFGSEPPIGLPPPQDFGSDPQIVVPAAQDFGSEPPIDLPQALPSTGSAANNTGFDDFYGDQTYTVNYTGTADTVPAGNTGFDDFYGDQTYTANFTGTADARPVIPATNSQVPDLFSSISSLLSNLFGIRPTVVSPAANPQVAQAFPVPAPTVFRPTPIPPAANPQVPLAQDFGSEPRIVVPLAQDFGSDPQIGLPPPQDFGSEPPIVVPTAQDYGTDPQVPEPPIVQNYFTDEPAPIVQNYFTDAAPEPIVQNYFTDATPVVPASNPEVPQPTPPAPTAESIVNQANPDLAEERFALKIQIERELQPQIARELQEQNPTWSPSRVYATSQLRAGAQADAAVDFRLDQQITAASQNPPTVTPEANPEVPQPTQDFGGRKKADPDIVDSPSEPAVQAQAETRIDGPVNQALLQQSNPAVATDYRSYVVDTQNKIVEQQTRELEATQGYPASENQIAVINGEAFGTATIAANVRFKNQVESADAAQSVPANTPPPTIAPADVNVPALPNDVDPNYIPNPGPVDNTIDPEVPSSANTRVENVNQSEFAQKDPTVAQQYNDFKNETAAQLTTQRIAEREAVEGGPISVSEQVQIAARAEIDATADANFRYQDQIQAAGAGTVVPADTPPPTVTAPAVSTESNPQVVVPPTRVVAVSTETLLQNDPETAQEYTAFKNETAAQLTEQRIAEREAVEGGEISVSEQVQIAARAEVDATADANFRYQDQIEAAGAATVVPADTPPPTVIPPAQDFGTDPQVPPAQDFGSEPPIVVPAAQDFGTDPQVPLAQDFGQDPPIVVPAAQDFGVDPQVPLAQDFGSEPPIIVPDAQDFGVDPQVPLAQDFGSEPPLPAPAPPSPSPYERFLAEEAAATTAAEAEATARFNAQFDNGGNIIGSAADPQVPAAQDFGSEPPIVVPDAQDFGTDPQVPDAQDFGSEPPILVPDAQDFGVDPQAQDFGTDADFNIGEFQSEPVDIPTIETGYDDFYGNEADVGEFQSEPVDIPTIETGYDDFYGNEEDVGEFQAEPDIVGSDDTGFGDFSDTGGGDGGDFFGSIFGSVKKSAGAVSGGSDPVAGLFDSIFGGSSPKANPKTTVSPQQAAANREKAAKALAKQQSIINRQRKQANDGDWRVKLRLAGNSNYLYNAFNPGILKPLEVTDGVIFPYTPTITTAYQAKYNAYELTHSNYKGYFYQGSSVGDITINATFTAQDTSEANYLLAVIHFFRSVTKMFYGKDDAALRGAPPPLVFLQGLGEYQFNLHPCVVSNFNYTMPNDVDYIRALSPNNNGTNLTDRRSLQSGVTPFVNPSSSRLQNAGLPLGGITTPAAPPTLGTNSPTYVPTKMEIQITLLAIQTRSQVSNQFSLKQFANGDLIRGGFW
jgi:hypothetical protein